MPLKDRAKRNEWRRGWKLRKKSPCACGTLMQYGSTVCRACHDKAMAKLKAATDKSKARKRAVLAQARALKRAGRKPFVKKLWGRKDPCPICGKDRWNEKGRYISTTCRGCMGLLFTVLGMGKYSASEDVLTPQRVSDAIAYINANPEVRRSYQWLKRNKGKLKEAKQLLNQPKQAA